MVPSAFMTLADLPLTPNGKVDRRALPAPTASRPDVGEPFATPRNAIEERLAQIWCEVLKLERVSIHDDFFELGGHSLLVMRTWARIKEVFGQDHSIATFFRNRTIAEMAADLAERERTESSPAPGEPIAGAVPVPTLAWVDYVGQGAKHLEAISKIPLGFYTDEHLIWQYDSIEERSTVYLKRLREQQPTGPYRICGICGGAHIAFEMARQLREQGEEVPLLLLISPRPARSASRWQPRVLFTAIRSDIERLRHHFERIKNVPLSEWPYYCRAKTNAFFHRLLVRAKLTPNPVEVSDFWMARPHLKRAILTYEPKEFPGRVTLILPKQKIKIHRDMDFGWGRVAGGGLEVRIVPGQHGSLFKEPAIDFVAHEIRAAFEESCRSRTIDPPVNSPSVMPA
jgi:thioesterase domain-containing protein